jgi:lysophospholipase L1-like esterase
MYIEDIRQVLNHILVSVLLLALVGCGGGGSGNASQPPDSPGPQESPPEISSIDDITVQAGSLLSFDVNSINPRGGDPPILGASIMPDGASFSDHGDGTGTLTWRPDIGTVSSSPHMLVITAVDPDRPVLSTDEDVLIHVEMNEDFASIDKWTQVDDISSPQSSWNVSSGTLHQNNKVESTNSFVGAFHLGTYVWLTEGLSLTDYKFSVETIPLATLQSNDIGVMFRYLDNDNYYRLSMNARYGFTRLEKRVNGVFTPLAVNARGYIPGQVQRIVTEVTGDHIRVWINDEMIFAHQDNSLASGTVALYTQDRVAFNKPVIQSASNTPSVSLTTPISYSVITSDEIIVNAIRTQVPDGGEVEFLLDGTRSEVDDAITFSALFDQVNQGNHVVEAIMRDSSAVELIRDRRIQVGVQGDYYIAIGDSITNGVTDNYSLDNVSQSGRVIAVQGYQATLVDLLDNSLTSPVIIFNEGIGGDESVDTAFTRITPISDRHPGSNAVLVMLGTNDALSGIPGGAGCSGIACEGTFKGNMQALINQLAGVGKSVHVALVPPVFGFSSPFPNPAGNTVNSRVNTYNDIITSELTGRQSGPDLYGYFLGDGINRFSLFTDTLHPNALGYSVISHLWHNVLNPGSITELPLVLENMTRSTVSPYIKQNLLDVGDFYYVDRNHNLTAIPSVLSGGVWVMTAANDAGSTETDHISFNVDRPVSVYIAYDADASTLPGWMSAYTDTGLSVNTNNPVARTMSLFRRDFDESLITLGGNQADGAVGADANYVAIVVPDGNE